MTHKELFIMITLFMKEILGGRLYVHNPRTSPYFNDYKKCSAK